MMINNNEVIEMRINSQTIFVKKITNINDGNEDENEHHKE